MVDRVEADRPRFGPAPVALTMEDVERRKVEAELCCRICWLARREGTGDGGAGRELEREEARERLLPMTAVERLAVDCGRSPTTCVEDPSLMSGSSAERWGSVEEIDVWGWFEAGLASIEPPWAYSLGRESSGFGNGCDCGCGWGGRSGGGGGGR